MRPPPAGSIYLSRNESAIAKVIGEVTKGRGEGWTKAIHCAPFPFAGWCMDALPGKNVRVTMNFWPNRSREILSDGGEYIVYAPRIPLAGASLKVWQKSCRKSEHRIYSAVKIVAQLGDGGLEKVFGGEVFVLRRIARLAVWFSRICSEVVGRAGKSIGVLPDVADMWPPDSVCDFLEEGVFCGSWYVFDQSPGWDTMQPKAPGP